jgi:hypothetical protein
MKCFKVSILHALVYIGYPYIHQSISQAKTEGKVVIQHNLFNLLYTLVSYGKINRAEGMSPNVLGTFQKDASTLRQKKVGDRNGYVA